MSMTIIREALLWCTVSNYGVLFLWWLCFLLAHDWMYQFHGRWFHLSVEQFDAMHYGGDGAVQGRYSPVQPGPVYCSASWRTSRRQLIQKSMKSSSTSGKDNSAMTVANKGGNTKLL